MFDILPDYSVINALRWILDVAVLAFILYKTYSVMEETQAVQLLRGMSFMLILYGVAQFFSFKTLQWILGLIAPGLFIALAIIFQPELRSIFTRMGQRNFLRFRSRNKGLALDSVLNAAGMLAGQKRGALIVFSRDIGLKNIIDSGTVLDAELSSSLIVSIFGHDTPLHDGAMVLQGGRITAAGCFLPLSRHPYIERSFGTRHRAALGLVEETDAVVLVVSEETGALSLAYDSHLFYALSQDEIVYRLKQLLNLREEYTDEGVSIL